MLTSSGEVTLTTVAGGLVGETGKLPLSGYAPSQISLSPNAAQIVPAEVTVTRMYVHATTTLALSLIGTTIEVQVRLMEMYGGEQVRGLATCALSPALTGVLGTGTEMTASCSLSVPIEAGTLAFLQVEATASGLSLIDTVGLRTQVGLTMS